MNSWRFSVTEGRTEFICDAQYVREDGSITVKRVLAIFAYSTYEDEGMEDYHGPWAAMGGSIYGEAINGRLQEMVGRICWALYERREDVDGGSVYLGCCADASEKGI